MEHWLRCLHIGFHIRGFRICIHFFIILLLRKDSNLKCPASIWNFCVLVQYLVYTHSIAVLRIPSFYCSTSHTLILFQYLLYPHSIAVLAIPSFYSSTCYTLILFQYLLYPHFSCVVGIPSFYSCTWHTICF